MQIPHLFINSLDSVSHFDHAVDGSWYVAHDEQETSLGVDFNNSLRKHGGRFVTHLTGHFLPLKDLSREFTVTDGTRQSVGLGVTVSSISS